MFAAICVVIFVTFFIICITKAALGRPHKFLYIGRCGLRKKIEVRGVAPLKLISFDPFVNCVVVILVNCLDFVIFSIFYSYLFLFFPLDWPFCVGGEYYRTPLHPEYAPAKAKSVTRVCNRDRGYNMH